MELLSIEKELTSNPYPGRGILIGKSADGKNAVIAYFIMGRSENSRNRIFVEEGEGIRTQAFDESKLEDPSLIPSFCGEGFYGLRVHEEALSRGVKVTGATAHFVNEICDGGPIILQRAVEIHNGDTPEILQKRVMEQAEWHILPQAVALFCDDKIKVIDNKTTEILA